MVINSILFGFETKETNSSSSSPISWHLVVVSCIAWKADQAKSQPQEEITNEILDYTKTQKCEEKLLCKAKLKETKKEEEKTHLQKIKKEAKKSA